MNNNVDERRISIFLMLLDILFDVKRTQDEVLMFYNHEEGW